MWPNNIWNFGNTGGGVLPPWQSGGGVQQGGSDVPWWVGFGVGLGERLGVWDWAADWLGTGGANGGSTGGGGYQGTWGGPGTGSGQTGITGDFLTGFLPIGYQGDENQRRTILTYYKNLEGGISNFLQYLSQLGLAAQIVQRLSTGDIFAWPKIVQDLIILFYHNRPKADELAPTVVDDANRNAAAPSLGGGSLTDMLGVAAAMKPVTLPLVPREAYHVPKGYVLVRHPQTRQPAVVRKDIARAAGLFKGRAKAPITATEWKAVKKAKRYEQKLARMLGDSCNFKVTKKR